MTIIDLKKSNIFLKLLLTKKTKRIEFKKMLK